MPNNSLPRPKLTDMSTLSARLPKENPWTVLRRQDGIISTLRYPGSTILDLYRGLNPAEEYLFMLRLPEEGDKGRSKSSLPEIDGCRVEYQLLGRHLHCCLILENNENWRIFAMLCNLLRDALEAHAVQTNAALVESFIRQLMECRDFFARRRAKTLTPSVAQGLYGELCFLRDAVMPSLPEEDWLPSWVGPLSDRQDFSVRDTVVEIKTKTMTSGNAIGISSIEQLCPQGKGYLWVNRLTPGTAGESLAELVTSISAILSMVEQQEVFRRLLAYTGYRECDEHTELYQRKWKLAEHHCYEIREGFPRILATDLMEGIVVDKVRYAIDQSSLEPFKAVPSWIEH